jgi:hypothetical protein
MASGLICVKSWPVLKTFMHSVYGKWGGLESYSTGRDKQKLAQGWLWERGVTVGATTVVGGLLVGTVVEIDA